MSVTYAYKYPCLVQDPLEPNNVLVIGINGTTDATLEMTRVDLSDIMKPRARRINSVPDPTVWSPTLDRVCDVYPRENWIDSVPVFYMRQFGEKSYMVDMLSNGTVYKAFTMTPPLVAPKLYSSVGEYRSHKWVTALSSQADSFTGSPWAGHDIYQNSTGTYVFYTFRLQNYPPADARLSVGTYGASSSMPVFGYLTVFDAKGMKGWVYQTTSSYQTEESSTSLQALAAPVEVDMNGIQLSSEAISITMGSVGYIADRAMDGTTVLYSISPDSKSTPKLTCVPVNGKVPRFLPGRACTVMSSNKLLLFGGIWSNNPTSIFNIFDTSSLSWSGPYLEDPEPPETTKPNIGAIVGGITAAVLVLVLALFLYRRFCRKEHIVVIPTGDPEDRSSKDRQPSVVMTEVVVHQPQHQYQRVGSVYEPIMHSPEQLSPEQLHKQPVIFQPQVLDYSPPATARHPQDPNYFEPLLTSVTYENMAPIASVNYTDRLSKDLPSPPTHTVHTSTSIHLGSPQYVPPPGGGGN
ncbi:hypothetical protein BGW42_005899 [Actinomortierella wolfii]|nr:hypothetical protein BGW42_005899 [Actinomortierella wolfii]